MKSSTLYKCIKNEKHSALKHKMSHWCWQAWSICLHTLLYKSDQMKQPAAIVNVYFTWGYNKTIKIKPMTLIFRALVLLSVKQQEHYMTLFSCFWVNPSELEASGLELLYWAFPLIQRRSLILIKHFQTMAPRSLGRRYIPCIIYSMLADFTLRLTRAPSHTNNHPPLKAIWSLERMNYFQRMKTNCIYSCPSPLKYSYCWHFS